MPLGGSYSGKSRGGGICKVGVAMNRLGVARACIHAAVAMLVK